MDPNKTLGKLRALMNKYNVVREDGNDQEATLEVADELVEAIESLDSWLSRGGYLPSGWSAKR